MATPRVTRPHKKTGRPAGSGSKYSEDVAQEICHRIAEGETLQQICRDINQPARTVYDWQDDHPEFATNIARARRFGHDEIAARARETARGRGDSTQDVQRDKLIIETDLKLLAKWDPRYSDKIAMEHSGGVQISGIKVEFE